MRGRNDEDMRLLELLDHVADAAGYKIVRLRLKGGAERLRLQELLDPVAAAAGYEIVRLRLMGGAERRRLQVMAEDRIGEMVVADCAILSRKRSEVLDAADPITGEY